ncbi:hypothetical protein [Methanolobus vulcani]|nr:hypothetical protein [Methanolobus vulcani]
MYESLKDLYDDFHMYIFAFDKKCYEILNILNLDKVSVIELCEFEDKELLEIKPTRSTAEYCWTCTPSIILYSIEKYDLSHCTYLDADIYFFSSPEELINEMDEKSILITEHRYTKKYDKTETSGKYCVQFVTFKNNISGLTALKWWRNACLDWCYAKYEDGKLGDQKYLDDWTQRFEGVHVLKHLGGGVAPWNVQQYTVYESNKQKYIKENSTQFTSKIVFYHFHGIKFFTNGSVDLNSGYCLSDNTQNLIYKDYVKKIKQMENKIAKIDKAFDPNGSTNLRKGIKHYIWILICKLKKTHNCIKVKDFIE